MNFVDRHLEYLSLWYGMDSILFSQSLRRYLALSRFRRPAAGSGVSGQEAVTVGFPTV